MAESESWPPLPLHEWQDTYRTLHMWTQIVGKIRMTLSPPLNQWWHVSLYVNSRGLTTGPVPYPPGLFEIQLDFLQQGQVANAQRLKHGGDKGTNITVFSSGV